jgi:hypothetical protein
LAYLSVYRYWLLQPKKLKSSSTGISSTTGTATISVQTAKKKATLKDKVGKGKAAHAPKGLLGDADYVTLMMGGRRKAKQEAEKLVEQAHVTWALSTEYWVLSAELYVSESLLGHLLNILTYQHLARHLLSKENNTAPSSSSLQVFGQFTGNLWYSEAEGLWAN